MIKINEIFYSIQGESTYAGLPCVFIRLTYCNLRCTYCDTEYAFYEGTDFTIEQILNEISKYNCKLIEVTGGEPLMQDESHQLMEALCNAGYTVLLETGGSLPINKVDPRVKIIMDLKTPSSGMLKKNKYDNIQFLKNTDEIKFVIGSRDDYEWAVDVLDTYKLTDKCTVLFSTVFDKLNIRELAEWILKDNLKVRFQLQMHKFIWEPDRKGV
ncbi:MAG TPA: 7-carboxy-7-deazaguanine synthase QueE [Ignavibacteriaceae bacterium]|nr:7-carboxy-7-deazaguanine synthase QueE [Ignavibacteriaceae bacterium]